MSKGLIIYLSITMLLIACIVFFFKIVKTSKGQIWSADTVIIEFKNNTYTPNNVSIKKDQTITFVNHSDTDIWPASNIHPTHGIYPEFDPKKAISPGNSWSFTFDKVGTWRFHDHLMPQITGEISVN